MQQPQGLAQAAQNGTVAHLAPLQMGVQSSGAPMMNVHNGNQYTQAGGAAHLQPMSAPPMINSNGPSPFFNPPASSGEHFGIVLNGWSSMYRGRVEKIPTPRKSLLPENIGPPPYCKIRLLLSQRVPLALLGPPLSPLEAAIKCIGSMGLYTALPCNPFICNARLRNPNSLLVLSSVCPFPFCWLFCGFMLQTRYYDNNFPHKQSPP